MEKRLCVLIIGFILCLNASAQKSEWGFIVGPQMTSAHYTVDGNKQKTEYKPGVHAGAIVRIPFENLLYFTPSFYYSKKGYKVALTDPSFPPGDDAVSNDVNVHVFEIAPLFNVDLSKKPDHFFVRFGPSIDAAFKGDEKVTLNTGEVVKQDMTFDFGEYGRFTSNAIIQFGYETAPGWMIFGHYTHGLGSMNNADHGPKIKHRIFGITVGRFFRRDQSR